jgi:hypothetical protein
MRSPLLASQLMRVKQQCAVGLLNAAHMAALGMIPTVYLLSSGHRPDVAVAVVSIPMLIGTILINSIWGFAPRLTETRRQEHFAALWVYAAILATCVFLAAPVYYMLRLEWAIVGALRLAAMLMIASLALYGMSGATKKRMDLVEESGAGVALDFAVRFADSIVGFVGRLGH